MSHKYKMIYNLDPQYGEFTAEEVKAKGLGGTDALIMASILYPEDGSLSQMWMSFDGRNGGKELHSNEVFKFWIMLASSLSEKEDLSPGKKAFCKDVFETFRAAMMAAKTD